MRGYISVTNSEQGQIRIESRTGIYRDPNETERILAETEGNTIPLGIADVTVSRKKGGQAPVVITPQSEFIEIHNKGNSNGVTIVSKGDTLEVDEGRVETVTRDSEISIGYQTEFLLTVEREAKVEQNVVNKGSGDVVMGDSIDHSTTVGDDNVMNRSDLGGTESTAPLSPDQPADGTGSASASTGDAETQFCIGCGSEIATHAAFCPNCGQKQATEETGAGNSDTQNFCEKHQRTHSGSQCPECASSNSLV